MVAAAVVLCSILFAARVASATEYTILSFTHVQHNAWRVRSSQKQPMCLSTTSGSCVSPITCTVWAFFSSSRSLIPFHQKRKTQKKNQKTALLFLSPSSLLSVLHVVPLVSSQPPDEHVVLILEVAWLVCFEVFRKTTHSITSFPVFKTELQFGVIAQSVVRRADNAKVPGSIPGNTNLFIFLLPFFPFFFSSRFFPVAFFFCFEDE